MNFGEIIRSYRAANEMTQKELADKLSISPSAIGMYEQGRREPDFDTLTKIADVFNISLDHLLGREDNENHASQNIASRIKQLRKDAGLTQEALGKKLGVIKQTVSSWENNISEPNSEVLSNMASIFNVSIGYLYGDSSSDIDYKNYHTDGPNYYLNEETAQLAQEMYEDEDMRSLFDMKRNMPPERFKAHMDFMKNLYNQEKGNSDV